MSTATESITDWLDQYTANKEVSGHASIHRMVQPDGLFRGLMVNAQLPSQRTYLGPNGLRSRVEGEGHVFRLDDHGDVYRKIAESILEALYGELTCRDQLIEEIKQRCAPALGKYIASMADQQYIRLDFYPLHVWVRENIDREDRKLDPVEPELSFNDLVDRAQGMYAFRTDDQFGVAVVRRGGKAQTLHRLEDWSQGNAKITSPYSGHAIARALGFSHGDAQAWEPFFSSLHRSLPRNPTDSAHDVAGLDLGAAMTMLRDRINNSRFNEGLDLPDYDFGTPHQLFEVEGDSSDWINAGLYVRLTAQIRSNGGADVPRTVANRKDLRAIEHTVPGM